MPVQTFPTTASSYRSEGRAAIASGIIGIIAYGLLITAVTTRTSVVVSNTVYLLFRSHDVSAILQFLLLIPVAFALYKVAQQMHPGTSRRMLSVGIGALVCTALFLLLGIFKILSDGLYTFPMGIFGIWLIIINWRLSGMLPKALRWFGMVVGFGLALLGTVEPGYAIFVDPVILHIPAVEPTTYPGTTANFVIHRIIWIGSFTGILTLPFWTLLVGRRLLREKRF